MKKPRSEMTNEAAKFLLNTYRPNGADALDPVFRAALDQAAHDPELATWFKEQRSFDSRIAAKLAEIQPPPHLYSAILAGIATRSPARRFPMRPILALAAMLILCGTILVTFFVEHLSRTASLEAYQRANLTMLSAPSWPQLDLVTDDFSRTQEYLASMKAPRVPDLPGALLNLPTAGCKALYWNNQMLSLTCFRLPDGELLHVFVIDEEAFKSVNPAADFREMDGWRVKFERCNGMLVMFVSRAPMAEIKKYIS
jgi:hypothetical protein